MTLTARTPLPGTEGESTPERRASVAPVSPRAGREPPAAVPVSHRRTFPGRPDAVSGARRFVAGVLAGSPVADAAELALGELGANAVLHSRSRQPGGVFTVRTEIAPGWVRLEVTDLGGPWSKNPGSGPDEENPASGSDKEHGRGLEIVSQLASLWGVITRPGSRTVWCEFAVAGQR